MASKTIFALFALCALSAFTSANVLRQAEVETGYSDTVSIQIETELNINEITAEVAAALEFINQKGLSIHLFASAAIARIPAEVTNPAEKLDYLLENLKQELQKSKTPFTKEAVAAVQTIQDDLEARLAALTRNVDLRNSTLDAQTDVLFLQHEQNAAKQRQQFEAQAAARRAQLEQELADEAAKIELTLAENANQIQAEADSQKVTLEQYSTERHNDLSALKINILLQIRNASINAQAQITKVVNFIQKGLLKINNTVNNHVAFKLYGVRTAVTNDVAKLNGAILKGALRDEVSQVMVESQGKLLKLRELLPKLAEKINKDLAAAIQDILYNLGGVVAKISGSEIKEDLDVSIAIPRQ